MKLRTGFVSNSSSSSYLIIGTNKKSLIEALLVAEELDVKTLDVSHGICTEGKVITSFIGQYEETPYLAGIDAEDLLMKKSGNELRKYMVKLIKENLNLETEEADFGIFYGESSSE